VIRQLLGFSLATITAVGCGWRHARKPVPMPPGARRVVDVAYFEGADADPHKHRLDMVIPAGAGPHPVLLFVHGGGWRSGDRKVRHDIYGKLAKRMAARGILTVVPSYRLAPTHKHPAHVRDVARAVAWTLRRIGHYGGDPRRVVLCGHSAGAHLVALVTTDPRWLAERGVTAAQIRGVIGISGPYDLAAMPRGTFLRDPAFGTDPRVWKDASPATHLGQGRLPPFLVAHASDDPGALHSQAESFAAALTKAGAPPERFLARDRSHFTVIFRLGEPGDPLGRAVVRFIRKVNAKRPR